MRRGFKKEAKELAVDVRSELGLGDHDPLDPWALMTLLDIPVLTLSEFQNESQLCVHHFTTTEVDVFSAVTVFHGSRRLIVHNDAHARSRQVSNLTHEAAHGLLHHTPAPAMDELGCRQWNDEAEKEAEYLAGALLVPDNAALRIVRKDLPLPTVAEQLGISTGMLSYRLNVSGARTRVRRYRQKLKRSHK